MRSTEDSHRTKGLVRLTMACNERCPFCNVPAEDYPSRPTPEAELSDAIAEFVAAGEQTLTISGGEPTILKERLLALIREARQAGIPLVELQTNAILITPEYAQSLADAGLTSAFVSLLSDVPELHDALAGLNGAFPRCLAGLDALNAVGIRTTLNPVIAHSTQSRVPDYVDFVAERLPFVRSISLSAVQPHGRAAKALDLLPDYAVLAPAIRTARERARAHDIELLNPFCGLPLCVGWEDDVERSVEAHTPETGPGLDNAGNKRHGPQCRSCALRPRCPGAWHAYWDHRGGSGLQAPQTIGDPWSGDEGFGTLEAPTGSEISAVLDPANRRQLLAIRSHIRRQAKRPPMARVGLTLGIRPASSEDLLAQVRLATGLGVDRVRVLSASDSIRQTVGQLQRLSPALDIEAV